MNLEQAIKKIEDTLMNFSNSMGDLDIAMKIVLDAARTAPGENISRFECRGCGCNCTVFAATSSDENMKRCPLESFYRSRFVKMNGEIIQKEKP